MNPRRLYRSTNDRWIGGVAAGVADYFDVDPTIVRILWLVSMPFTGFVTLIVYIIMLIVVPLGPDEWPEPAPWQPGGAPLGYSASYAPPSGTAGDAAGPGTDPAAGFAAGGSAADAAAGSAANATPGATATGAVPPTQGWDWRSARRQERWQRRADRWEHRAERWEQHRGSGGLFLGAILIVVGGLAAWHQIDPGLDLSIAWPLAAIALGVFLIATSFEFRRG